MRKLALPPYPLRALHLVTVWAYAVSQPVFSLLEANPEFLVVRGSSRAEVVVFALLLVFVPPLLALACELVVRLVSARAADLLHLALLGAFVVPLALQLQKLLDASGLAAMLGAAAVAFLAVLVYARVRAAALFLTFSAALPLIGLFSFVLGIPLASTGDVAKANVKIAAKTPVILLVLDELPVTSLLTANGEIDGGRYPNFARLARDGTWYRSATTVHEHTTYAVPAILDGRLPEPGNLPTLAHHPENVFTLLGESYDVRASEALTHLCPRRYCKSEGRASLLRRLQSLFEDVRVAYLHRTLPKSLAGGLPPINDRWGGFGRDPLDAGVRDLILAAEDADEVDRVLRRVLSKRTTRTGFERFLFSIRRSEPRQTLHFVHLLQPHTPWNSLPSGREYGNGVAIEGLADADTWGYNPWLIQQGHQRHLLQVAYTDKLVGRVLDRLQATALYDDALVVVTADHGVSFAAGAKRRGISREHVADIARVPLFVKFPGQTEGRVDPGAARTIDIVPTIADVLGVALPWSVDGRSLRDGGSIGKPVAVGTLAGRLVEASVAEVERDMREKLRLQSSLFGPGVDGLYEIGSNREFLGLPVAQRATQTASATRVRLDGEELLQDVRLSSAFVPARISGSLDGAELGEDVELAVAVNGRIGALTRWFRLGGKQRFTAIVPDAVFQEGANRVELFSIEDGGGSEPRLIRLGGAGAARQYELADDGTSMSLPDGGLALVKSGRIEGNVDSWVVESGTVRLRGWAADFRARSAPDRVLLFASGRLIYSGETTLRTNNPAFRGVEPAGWTIEIPARELKSKQLRIFAVRGSSASELPLPRDFPWA